MRASVPAAALLAVLAFPAVAAADATVRAVDVTNTWSPAEVTIKAGEKVDWAFASFPHNVKNKSANWEFASLNLVAPQTASNTFTTPGEYEFLCALHGSTMTGKVIVLGADGQAPAPLPPPPLSEQPLANDIPPLSVFEVRDTVVPKLDRVKVSRVARGVRVKFRLSEAGKVTVKATRGRSVTTRTVEVAKGTRSITVKGLKTGSYRVQVSAKDLAGNAAKSAPRASVTVRR
ncbi:cupredoxin domain-containing protein [Solirubrobacter taibaiensis]|nr:cupredoxin domain-containing protein [Solirubrobacter taibaiensis]